MCVRHGKKLVGQHIRRLFLLKLCREIVCSHTFFSNTKHDSPWLYLCRGLQIVNLTGQEKQDKIITKLQDLILKLKKEEATDLTSSTICVSQCNQVQNSVRYYGVSMSTSGPNSGRIITAASCLSTWDSYVAGAVMTYYPENSITQKKTYFDGTIIVPNTVKCEAFSLSLKKQMLPCQSCANLFGFSIFDPKVWPYGNCAEAESLSNLFKNENKVKDQAQPTSETYNEINMQRAEVSVRRELENILRMVHFTWDQTFYTPQGA